MAREVKNFNVRILTVNPAIFDTPMIGALQYQSAPLAEDYQKHVVGITLAKMREGTVVADNDTKKGIKAIYEVIVGEGIGEGHESEPMLPLGRDSSRLLREIKAQYEQTLEIFGQVCDNNV
jgi:hypothetical protein